MDTPLLSVAYLPPVEYFSIMAKYGSVHVEANEHFVKQTYRNRAVILGANGPLPLIIPLKKGKNNQQLITETEIDYSSNWQTVHWRAIKSAYGGSPFFEHYADFFAPYYERRYLYLFEYNIELTKLLLKLFRLNCEISFSSEFIVPSAIVGDYRYSITPKTISSYTSIPYRQVFSDKFVFTPNLSAIDLLFCLGNRANAVLN